MHRCIYYAFMYNGTTLQQRKLKKMANHLNPIEKASGKLDWQVFSHALLNASPNGVFAVNEYGLVLFSNHRAQRKLGLYNGVRLRRIFPELWLEIRHVFKHKTTPEVVTLQEKDTHYIVKIRPIEWKNETIGMLCVVEDVSEFEEIAMRLEHLHHLSKELDVIVNSTYDGIWVCDGQANVIRINAASERINNIRADDVVGTTMQSVMDRGLIDNSVTLEVLKQKNTVSILQETKDGKKLMVTGNPVFDKNGNIYRVVTNERDISELEKLHTDLQLHKLHQEHLYEQIAELNTQEMLPREIIARSKSMLNVVRQALKIAPMESTVLIQGETGAGKGLLVNLIHQNSHRSHKNLIKINCGAIPEALIESELFGYEKGAFTGAHTRGKVGYLELANDGNLFLDEIGELPFAAQVKLLHFLEDGVVTRVGGTTPRKLNVRILAATNRKLEELVQQKKFRSDLYYRLNVIPLHVPPLREREECLLPLLQYYLDHFAEKLSLSVTPRLAPVAMRVLMDYDYPGNVRELINLCERLIALSTKDTIDFNELPKYMQHRLQPAATDVESLWQRYGSLKEAMAHHEKTIFAQARQICQTQEEIAQRLDVNQATVARKLKKYQL